MITSTNQYCVAVNVQWIKAVGCPPSQRTLVMRNKKVRFMKNLQLVLQYKCINLISQKLHLYGFQLGELRRDTTRDISILLPKLKIHTFKE